MTFSRLKNLRTSALGFPAIINLLKRGGCQMFAGLILTKKRQFVNLKEKNRPFFKGRFGVRGVIKQSQLLEVLGESLSAWLQTFSPVGNSDEVPDDRDCEPIRPLR